MLCENCLRPICNKYHNQNNHFLKKTFKTNFIILHLPVHHNHQQNCRSPFHLARIYYFYTTFKISIYNKILFFPLVLLCPSTVQFKIALHFLTHIKFWLLFEIPPLKHLSEGKPTFSQITGLHFQPCSRWGQLLVEMVHLANWLSIHHN